MSRNFRQPGDVPNTVLADRSNELSHAVAERMHGNEKTFSDESTCRIPVEVDRDADFVLLEAARRLRTLGYLRNRGLSLQSRFGVRILKTQE